MTAMRSTLTIPPRFYEYEKQEMMTCEEFIILDGPQKFKLKQVEIIPRFERYLTQEECPYQEEMRTILFQQGEYDGHLLGHRVQPFEANSFNITSFQIQPWQDLFSYPLFEFHGKRQFIKFYLSLKMPFSKRGIIRSGP